LLPSLHFEDTFSFKSSKLCEVNNLPLPLSINSISSSICEDGTIESNLFNLGIFGEVGVALLFEPLPALSPVPARKELIQSIKLTAPVLISSE